MAFRNGDEGAELAARKAALGILGDAVERCPMQDMRNDEVKAALDHLRIRAVRQEPFRLFWEALHHANVKERRAVARAALRKVMEQVPSFLADSRRNDF